jgi:hypothetical protein
VQLSTRTLTPDGALGIRRTTLWQNRRLPDLGAGHAAATVRRETGVQETAKQRWDRNFADLLQELRVAQTGVQILFAFLLTLPFSAQFPKTTALQRGVYHRALFRQRRKPELVRYAHRMATGGLAAMLVSVVSSVLLIADVVLHTAAAVAVTVAVAVVFLLFWVVLPIVNRNRWSNGQGVDVYADEGLESDPVDPGRDGAVTVRPTIPTDR